MLTLFYITTAAGTLASLCAIGLFLQFIIRSALASWRWYREAPMRAARKALLDSKLKVSDSDWNKSFEIR